MADLSNSKYIGKWRIASVSVLGLSEPLTNENVLILNADGTAQYTSPEDPREYTWKETGYGVFLDGKSDMKLTADGDKLTTRLLGIITLNFERVE